MTNSTPVNGRLSKNQRQHLITKHLEAQAVKVSRGDASSLAKMLYYVAIQSAAKTVHIQNAYFLPDPQLRGALVAAARRGVDVRVMVPGRDSNLAPVRMASRHHYGELLLGGVKIYEYNGTMMHNKTAVVDGVFATIGSINRSRGSPCRTTG